MAFTWPDIIDKITDNANLGKVVTDVGSGFALTVPMLMLLGLWSGVSVIPADRIQTLNDDIKASEAKVSAEIGKLRPILDESAKGVGTTPLAQASDDIATYATARRVQADLASQLETKNTLIGLSAGKDGKEVPALTSEKRPMASFHDQLFAQKEAIDEERERLTALKNQRTDATALATNVETFTNNMSAVLAFSIVFGLVISQLSRLIFIRGLYDRAVRKSVANQKDAVISQSTVSLESALRNDPEIEKKTQELVSGYYRYAEGAVNMIAPVILFGVVFPFFITKRLGATLTAIETGGLIVATVTIAVGLYYGGLVTYQEYRKKMRELEAFVGRGEPDVVDPAPVEEKAAA